MKLLRLFSILLICCLFTITLTAKDVKIKFTSSMEYIGEGKKKVPDGKGVFFIYSKENKKFPILSLSGSFNSSEDQNTEISVKDAVLSFTEGLTFKSAHLTISIVKEKNHELAKFNIPNCQIIDGERNIESDDILIILEWLKSTDTEYKITTMTSGVCVISSDFISVPQVMSSLLNLDIKPVQETIDFEIEKELYSPFIPCQIKLKDVKEIVFDSGLNVSIGEDITYVYPNGNIMQYQNKSPDYSCSKIEMSFPEGNLSFDGIKLKINYSNGNQFIGDGLSSLDISPNSLHQIQSLQDLEFKNGIHYNGKSTEIFKDGHIVERTLPDGSISLGNSGQWSISYNNGQKFTGSNNNFIKNSDEVAEFSSVSDAILNNGKLTKTINVWDCYVDGVITGGQWPLADGGFVEYANNNPVKIIYPDGAVTKNVEFKNALTYTSTLESSDYEILNGVIRKKDGTVKTYVNGETEEDKLARIIKSKWNCEQVGFSGPIRGTQDGDEVFRMLFGLDHTYFEGEVMLGIQSDGKGVLVVAVGPSEKANRLSRPRAMQLIDACKNLNKTINGKWSLEGKTILINGEPVATLSSDNKTATYEGMVGATMKIIKKL